MSTIDEAFRYHKLPPIAHKLLDDVERAYQLARDAMPPDPEAWRRHPDFFDLVDRTLRDYSLALSAHMDYPGIRDQVTTQLIYARGAFHDALDVNGRNLDYTENLLDLGHSALIKARWLTTHAIKENYR